MEIRQLDVKTAFLNGDLDEEIFMPQPPAIESSKTPTLVCRLKKSLYGLKQAPRQWNLVIDLFLQREGFKQSKADICVYIKYTADGIILLIIAVYVDDMLIIGPQLGDVVRVKTIIKESLKSRTLESSTTFWESKSREIEFVA